MSYTNARWANAEHTAVFAEIAGTVISAVAGSPVYVEILAATSPAAFEAKPLATVKAELSAAIDQAAGRVRAKYVTDAPGQDLLYDRKRREAEYVTDQGAGADPALCPVLAASVGIEAPTLADCAALVLAKESQWAAIAAAIELRRLSGKAAVNAATTVAQAESAFAAIDWSGL